MTKAQVSFQRADRLYHLAIKAFFIFVVIMLGLIVYQVAHLQGDFTRQQNEAADQRDEDTAAARKRLEDALAETNRQQIVTQNYIRCVASVLLKPVEQRSEADFDACGIPGVTDPSKLGQPTTNERSSTTTPPTSPQAINPPQQPTQPNPTPPTTSGPPPDDRSPLGRLPLVGGLLDAIGL